MKHQDPDAGNIRIAVELSTAEVTRYQNTISGTSGHRSSTPMAAIDWQAMASY